jgi:hypothetical protein
MSTDSQKITEMQNTIASLNATVATLMTEVARLSNKSARPQHVMKTSIPLLPMQQAQPVRIPRIPQDMGRTSYGDMNRADDQKQQKTRSPIPLSTILSNNEEVTFFVYMGKDSQGQMLRTTAVTTFDGQQLKVTDCELASSLVGMTTQKPGEILYRFIDELKNGGHIKRTFSVAPWKLCFVKRNGVEITLDQLRANLEQSE